MKYLKKALAFIGAVALLFQGGCSAPDQENRENWETVIECQYEDMGISPNQQFLIAKKDGLYGAYVKSGDSYELKIPFQYVNIAYDSYEDANLFCSRQTVRSRYTAKMEKSLQTKHSRKYGILPARRIPDLLFLQRILHGDIFLVTGNGYLSPNIIKFFLYMMAHIFWNPRIQTVNPFSTG